MRGRDEGKKWMSVAKMRAKLRAKQGGRHTSMAKMMPSASKLRPLNMQARPPFSSLLHDTRSWHARQALVSISPTDLDDRHLSGQGSKSREFRRVLGKNFEHSHALRSCCCCCCCCMAHSAAGAAAACAWPTAHGGSSSLNGVGPAVRCRLGTASPLCIQSYIFPGLTL
eukprot:1141134-Pelagomonas_calceolata.AAC.9